MRPLARGIHKAIVADAPDLPASIVSQALAIYAALRPAGLPSDMLNFLNAEINRALAAPDLAQKATTLGIDARGSTPEEMHDRLAQDAQKWRQVIAQAGIPKQ